MSRYALAGAGVLGLLTACQNAPSMLEPRGSGGEAIADLWWLMFGLGTAVYVVVLGLLFFVTLRRRPAGSGAQRPHFERMLVLFGGVVIPAIILLVVLIATVWTQRTLAARDGSSDLTIEVTGYQFWWAVRYPDQELVTANEIHIPVGGSVEVILRSADVIHSFWVPQLTGKVDLFPGRTTTLTLRASDAGIYRGQCAEFCGIQHAKMAFQVVALPPEEFTAWIDSHRRPATVALSPTAQRGRELFIEKDCIYCHAVRGIGGPAGTDPVGPDLTYLAQRNTLAAGTIPNTRGHLGGWIVDPQSIKPGNSMPGTSFTSEELLALLEFLETLE